MEAVALVEVVAMAPVLLVLVHHIHRILRDMVLQQVQIINLHRHIPVDLPAVVRMTIARHLHIHRDIRRQHHRIQAHILLLSEDIQVQLQMDIRHQQLVVIQ